MKPEGCEADLLRALSRMPFLDRLEMVAVCGWSRSAVYEAVEKLETGGFCASVPHGTGLLPSSRRFHLTATGLRRLAGEEGMALDELVRSRPVSAQWRRSLMGAPRRRGLRLRRRLHRLQPGIPHPLPLVPLHPPRRRHNAARREGPSASSGRD